MTTQRENYLATCRGELPKFVSLYNKGSQPYAPEVFLDPYSQLYIMQMEYEEKGIADMPRCKDCFGVPFVLDEFGPIADPDYILFEDIEDWRDAVTFPVLTGYDWDAAVARDTQYLVPDVAVELSMYGVFGQLTNMMGFVDGLIAIEENPDEVAALFDAIVSFEEEVMEHVMTRVHCDVILVGDDFASETNMFVSEETYRRLIKPYHKRLYDKAREMNPDIILQQHTCGYIKPIIDDLVELGVQVWQPAQQQNDLAAIKAKYGNQLVFVGGWDNISTCAIDHISEEEVRQSVRDSIDSYAQGGGYVFWDGGPMGKSEKVVSRLGWAQDEAEKYGLEFYKTGA